jgi:O-antigen ligase
MTTFDLPLIVVALAMAVALCLVAVEQTIRRADVGAMLLFGAILAEIALPGVRLAVDAGGGAYLYLEDLVYLIVAAAGIARCLRMRRTTVLQRLLCTLGALAVASLVVGVVTFGPQSPVNEFRAFLGFLGAAIYFSTFSGPEASLDRIGKVVLGAAVVLVGIVCLRWVGELTGYKPELVAWEYDAPIRVLSGPETFFLAHALFLVLPRWIDGIATRRQSWLAALLLVVVTLLNRRTAWITVIAGLAVLLYRRKGLGGRARPFLAAVAVVAAMVFFSLPESETQGDVVGQSATDTGTLGWRVEGWQSLIAENGPTTATQWLIGMPMGSGYERQVTYGERTRRTLDTKPHSFYLEILLRTGLFGLAAFLALSTVALRRLRPGPPTEHGASADRPLLTREVLMIAVVMQLIWFATWQVGNEQGIITGMAAAAWWSMRRQAVDRIEGSHEPLPAQSSHAELAGRLVSSGPLDARGRSFADRTDHVPLRGGR